MPDRTPNPAAADRNLLFGILALQMDFVGRDSLIAAMHAWMLDKTKPLGQVLVGQGALRPDLHEVLDLMVQKHLEVHGNDPEKSLAAVGPPASIREELRSIADPDLQASLGHIVSTPALDPEATVDRQSLAGGKGAGLRYRILRPHAKGGLGEVFVAEDTELHREVALKQIQKERAADAPSRGRFLLEAEITGGLEHPGVVPVYGLGAYPDGRHFYAMRFVKGDSLKEAVERFHREDKPDRDPGERSLAFRELLGRFVDVCQAVAYAHSRGVLHRDLKPGNVMLGKYGETLVVDWGLAKAIGRAEGAEQRELPDDEATLRPSSGSELAATLAGTALGTPAYMSPEQAAGKSDLVGPASDVYSLGATLYTLLTGRAPFSGKDPGEILRRVQRGEVVPPRRQKPAVPVALEAVCFKAMALRPGDRYGTALKLAADVEHWLADEPVMAYREPVRVRLGRWARRHKPAVAAVAAAVLVALLLGGAGLVWAQRKGEERERGVEAALAKAADMQRQARWAEARAVLDQAENRLGEGGPEDLRRRLEQARRDLDLVARLDAIRLKRATVVEGMFDFAGADRGYAAAFQEAGLGAVGEDPGEVAARVRAAAVREELVAALDDWAASLGPPGPRLTWILAVTRLADPDPWRDRVRSPRVWNNQRGLARLAQGVEARGAPPRFVGVLGMRLQGLGGESEALLRAAQGRLPGDFWVNFYLGYALMEKKQWGEAVGYYRAALALRPDTPAVLNNLGIALADQGQRAEAIRVYRRALALDPKLALAHNNLGAALFDQGKLTAAVREYRRAIALAPKYAHAHYNLGNALADQGQRTAAVQEYRRAIALDPKYVMAHNNLGKVLYDQGQRAAAVREWRRALALDPKLALAHNNLGAALFDQGKLTAAVREYRRAIALDPKYAPAHNNLGNALKAQGKLTAAVREYRQAIALDPKDAHFHNNLGTALKAQGQLTAAVREFRRAIALDPKLVLAHDNLGDALQAQNKLTAAVPEYRRAIALDPKYAPAHNNLGTALYDQGQLTAAVREYRRAIALDPKNAMAHNNLGKALHDQGQLTAAVRAYRRALALDPKLALAHNNLGAALQAQGQLIEAVRAYRRAITLDPKLAMAHNNLGTALKAQGKLTAAVREYRQAIALDPKYALAHRNLGQGLLALGRFSEACQATRRCLGLLPPSHPQRQLAARQLRVCRQWLALDRKLPAILQGKAKPDSPGEQLNLAILCQQFKKRYAAAARLYGDAFAVQPALAGHAPHRYNAACAAALAAAGLGIDAGKLAEQEKARLRGEALAWLKADLARWGKQLFSDKPPDRQVARKKLKHWQKDSDLASVRDPAALAKLPEAERKEWTKFWAEVAALLKKAGPKKEGEAEKKAEQKNSRERPRQEQ
jgi:Tfp pilus assembly protein PilF/tRNA A-37 threonylcarbamoyl transferase component Bud32